MKTLYDELKKLFPKKEDIITDLTEFNRKTSIFFSLYINYFCDEERVKSIPGQFDINYFALCWLFRFFLCANGCEISKE